MHQSLWQAYEKRTAYPALEQPVAADIAVIGGGIAGVLCARLLSDAGAQVVLLEAGAIGGGVTGNTTAKVTAQHGLIYSRLIAQFGEEKARMYARANSEAIEEYVRMARHIDCDFARADAYVYALDDKTAEKVFEEREAAQGLGFEASIAQDTELPFPVKAALRYARQARLHPLKFLYGAADGLVIYEHSRVKKIEGTSLFTANGRVDAKKIVVCTHFPFVDSPGWYFARMHQSRSYVLALKNAPRFSGMYIDAEDTGLSFRPQHDLLLLGGGSHNCGEGRGENYADLCDAAHALYPKAEIALRWSAQDCVALDGLAYIGPYAKDAPDWFVATGFAKWGMTSAMAAAMILRDLIQGRANENAAVFDPARFEWAPSLANIAQEMRGLAEGYVSNKAAGRPVCTHLGCSLSYNIDEDSWDCPCHGSRFAGDGALLSGPAQRPLKENPAVFLR